MMEVIVLLLSMAALFSYINECWLKISPSIAYLILAFSFVLLTSLFHYWGWSSLYQNVQSMLLSLDFSEFVLRGVLSFILFAGASRISIKALENEEKPVLILAILGTLLAVFFVALICYGVAQLLGLEFPFLYALIFGAIIAPTDPIASLAILEKLGLPKRLQVIIDGESQFNDGIGVVLFTSFLCVVLEEPHAHTQNILVLFTREVVGGMGLGVFMAVVTHFLLRGVTQVSSEVLITLAAVALGYYLAEVFNVSGPLFSVVLGLLVGNFSLQKVISQRSKEHIFVFWDMVDQVLVAILFILMGLNVLLLPVDRFDYYGFALLCIPMVLLARYFSVYVCFYYLIIDSVEKVHTANRLSKLFTWAGLKGGLAIALVLALPASKIKSLLMIMTYAVVSFSIIVQGLSLNKLYSKNELETFKKIKI